MLKKCKSFLSLIIVAMITVSSLPFHAGATSSTMRDMTTMEIVKDMGIGINLGNTFESCGDWIEQYMNVQSYETAWGSPVITESMIEGYADAGFNSVRIPVSWSNFMADDYTINSTLLNRIETIVNYVLDNGMYAIVNIHYDGGWWTNFPTQYDECMVKYKAIWNQICSKFSNYSDYLIFESLNEEGGWSSVSEQRSYQILNNINQEFVNLVRSSGGNNASRHLLIAGYNTDIDKTCSSLFKMPTDPQNHCAVSVHYYTPFGFTHLEQDESWAAARFTWGTSSDYAELEYYLNKMKTSFVDKGIPVIIGEYGVAKSGLSEYEIRNYTAAVCEAAFERNMCPVLWDVSGGQYYNRLNAEMIDPLLEAEFKAIASSDNSNTNPTEEVSDGSEVLWEGNSTTTAWGDVSCGDLVYRTSDFNGKFKEGSEFKIYVSDGEVCLRINNGDVYIDLVKVNGIASITYDDIMSSCAVSGVSSVNSIYIQGRWSDNPGVATVTKVEFDYPVTNIETIWEGPFTTSSYGDVNCGNLTGITSNFSSKFKQGSLFKIYVTNGEICLRINDGDAYIDLNKANNVAEVTYEDIMSVCASNNISSINNIYIQGRWSAVNPGVATVTKVELIYSNN